MAYAGKVVGYHEPDVVIECSRSRMGLHDPAGKAIWYVHRGWEPGSHDGVWIPEKWVSSGDWLPAMNRICSALNFGMGGGGVGPDQYADSIIAKIENDVAGHKGQVQAKQKTIEDQAGKIREAMRRLEEFFPAADGKGLIGMVQIAIDRAKDLQRQAKDRDRYGKALSRIRELCTKALYGVDGANLPTSIKDVVSTTELVEGVIKIAKDQVEIIRRRRIEDSERTGAEMSARRNFVGRLHKLYRPGMAIGWIAGVEDKELRKREDELVAWLVDATTKLSQRDMNADVVASTRMELKSAGHEYEGAPLSDLVDRAIDKEREKHIASLTKIAKALNQEWSIKGSGGLYRPIEDWCSFLVNIITDFWQPRPERDFYSERPEALKAVADVAERAVGREEAKPIGRIEPIDGPFRFALVPREDLSDAAAERLQAQFKTVYDLDVVVLPANFRVERMPLTEEAARRLAELEERVRVLSGTAI